MTEQAVFVGIDVAQATRAGAVRLARAPDAPVPGHLGGRGAVRAVLYMSALTAIRWHPVLRAFYQRLCVAGKAKNPALIACLRKLLAILNALLRDQTPWPPRPVILA